MRKAVIIGAGHGGVQVATSLREEGFEGKITLISDENVLPYQKPPLSKGFLNGKQTLENLLFRNTQYYPENDIDLVLNETITRIDLAKKTVFAQSGNHFDYDFLILATGARNRHLDTVLASRLLEEGGGFSNIVYLRHLGDAQNIKNQLANSEKVVVIGGGFIGLEVAAAAVELGKKVTVIEAQARLLNRVLPPVVSDVFLKKHIESGVNVLLNAHVSKLHSDTEGVVTAVGLADNQSIEADLLVVGIGVLPNSELAEAAGLTCENGITVNEFLQTSDPFVFAIGDCVNYFNAFAGRNMRVESVQNAVDQAKTVAKNIVGEKVKYHAVPWFWTNQYDLKLQMAGIAIDFDQIILRGSVEAHKFSAFYFKNNKLLGVDSLNRAADHLAARKLLQANASPTMSQVEDLDFKLGSLC
jgi:3-phenylpropionate/trans-cinnamate dioxygenase ferredoxin reductase component